MKNIHHPSLHFSRRGVLRAGVATMLGLAVRDLVALAGTSHAPTADHVILLWFGGGMSHIDTFDPKPGRPVAGEFKPLQTSASGIEVSEVLPRIASQMKHASLIRSVQGVEGGHERAVYHVLNNYRPTPQMIHPTLGAIVAHELSPISDLPSFISINSRAPSAGYLGNACEAYYVGTPGRPDPYVNLPEGVTEVRASRRLEALAQVNNGFKSTSPDPELDATTATYDAAVKFMHSPALAAFKLDGESAEVRAAYGDTSFGKGCLLARRLVERGVRFVQVNAGGFDMHSSVFPAMRKMASEFDPAIGALISDLAGSGLLSRTLVLTLSEFGRTPHINDRAGRDHHPGVFSSLIAGGGVKPGLIIGESDPDGRKPIKTPVTPGDYHASICHALGINADKTVDTPLQRPMKLVESGKPVMELFGA